MSLVWLAYTKPALIIHSEWPVDAPDMPPAHNEVAFAALGDLTELTITMRYASAEIRKMVLDTGMTGGIGQSFDRLETVLAATLQAG